MGAAPLHHNPLPAQPPAQPEALRAALAQLAPHRLPEFDEDRARATASARSQTSAGPLRAFTELWAIEVAVERHPDIAARLRDLHTRASQAADLAEARAIAHEISKLRSAAAAEAGIPALGAAQ